VTARRWAASLAALFALAAAAPAHAGQGMETGIADDAVLLDGGQTAIDAVDEWKRIGVDVARVHVHWLRVAPNDGSASQPAGFDPRNPDDPLYHWAPLDNALALLEAAGIRPMLAVTGPGPLWTSTEPARGNPRYAPDSRKFGDFAYAVAKRYGARVQRYLIWNEPNQPAWLQPQFTCGVTRCVPASPHLYRALYRAADKAIRSVDPDAQVLIGTLAPKGQDAIARNRTMRPLQFVRALACVDDKRLARIRTGPCKGQSIVRSDGFAYHPHPVRFSPTTTNPIKDNAAIADMPHFEAVLDKATRNGVIKPTHGSVFDLYLTEFGYQTNPPDGDSGVSPATQARWLQQSWFQAWADPRVRNITQYEWRDEPLRVAGANSYASWQSGLRYENGKAKPALAIFPNPFYAQVKRGAKKVRLWGQVRPGTSWTVTVEKLAGGAYVAVKTTQTDAFGYWSQRLPLSGRATYRFSYVRDGVTVRSSSQTVKPLR
jgi:hypothetical protein